MDSCPQGGRVAGDGRPLPFCTTGLETCITAKTKERPLPVVYDGTPQASGSRHKGMLGKTRRQRPVQARQGHRKLMPGTKKTPSRCELQGGLRTIFGSGLLSHMTLCSIIGDGELNFRVRNGVGCTLSSMATKEISVHLLESDRVAQRLVLGHGPDAHSRRPRLARLVTFQNLH